MKLQYLTVIFILIIMPIIIVYSTYLDTQVSIIRQEASYDSSLYNSTYDAIKSFQINAINTTLYTPETRVNIITASANTFFNSLSTALKYQGNKSDVMKEYVPAVVFTMYDGYYIYSPFINTLTGVQDYPDNDQNPAHQNQDEVDDKYADDKVYNGLKPYVSYTVKYLVNRNIYYITYTMDNYISVDKFDSSNNYDHREGYLVSGIRKSGESYKYDNVTFNKSDSEALSEYLYLSDTEKGIYYYATIDGTKYYYEGNNTHSRNVNQCGENDKIFYINNSGTKTYQVQEYKNNKERFTLYYNRIFNNNSAYWYYAKAYEFTEWVRSNLSGLTISNIDKTNSSYLNYDFANVENIFDGTIQYSNSNFNQHRKDVIRAVISTNLSTAIQGFRRFSNSNEQFLMPMISDDNWELLENNICVATFLQGLKFGNKTYNSYAVVPNNYNKEYVDENDIYLLTTNYEFAKVNNTAVNNSNLAKNLKYQPGVLKINIKTRRSSNGYYNPLSYYDTSGKLQPYLGDYTSIYGSSGTADVSTIDMYRYVERLSDVTKKQVYYTALARERESSYKFINDNADDVLKNEQ